MSKTKIDYVDESWNPIIGCARGCNYCYARRMNQWRGWIPDFSKPQFRAKQARRPIRVKEPTKFLVLSLGDIFSARVKTEWVIDVRDVMAFTPRHTYYLLTKSPAGYQDYHWPENALLGTTITGENRTEDMDKLRLLGGSQSRGNRTWVSIEPLLGSVEKLKLYLRLAEFVAVGAMTGPGAITPKTQWITEIEAMKLENICWKKNIQRLLR